MPYRIDRDNAVAWFLSVWPLLVGVVVFGFSDRFTSRSWRFAGGMPGGYPMWSGILVACGLFMMGALIAGRHRGQHVTGMYIGGLVLVGSWWIILGTLFLITAIIDPLANPLGAAVWTGVGSLYLLWAWYERHRL